MEIPLKYFENPVDNLDKQLEKLFDAIRNEITDSALPGIETLLWKMIAFAMVILTIDYASLKIERGEKCKTN